MPCDPNEVFALLRATNNVDFLRQVNQTATARLEDINRATLGPAGQHLKQPHVQPSSELTPGAAAQPLTGPAPAPSSSGNLEQQAKQNEALQEAQRQSGRGPGYAPVVVSTGTETQEQNQQSQQVLRAYAEHQAQTNDPKKGAQPEGKQEGAGTPPEQQAATRPPAPATDLPTTPAGTGGAQAMQGAQPQAPPPKPAGGNKPQGGAPKPLAPSQRQGAK